MDLILFSCYKISHHKNRTGLTALDFAFGNKTRVKVADELEKHRLTFLEKIKLMIVFQEQKILRFQILADFFLTFLNW